MRHRPGSGILLAGIVAGVLMLVGCGSEGDDNTGDTGTVTDAEAVTAGATSAALQSETEPPAGEDVVRPAAPLSRRKVTLYFPSKVVDGLKGESREIFDTASPVERAKQILADLIAGPSGSEAIAALPSGTRLRQVFVLDSGLAYADFSAQLRDGMTGGSDGEVLAVYAIVNSLVLNIPEISSVTILVEGRPADSLNGHVDLRRPLHARPSLSETNAPVII